MHFKSVLDVMRPYMPQWCPECQIQAALESGSTADSVGAQSDTEVLPGHMRLTTTSNAQLSWVLDFCIEALYANVMPGQISAD